MKKSILGFTVIILFVTCKTETANPKLKLGEWKGIMTVSENHQLPFNFQVIESLNNQLEIRVSNADEEVVLDEVEFNGDSILIKMSVFDGVIKGTFTENSIVGNFIEEPRDRVVPFNASFTDAPRFENVSSAQIDVSGIWEVNFNYENEEDFYPAKGIFTQNNGIVTGTFRTPTGDYRYLEGVVDGEELKLSTFDGTHAFLFLAQGTDSTLNGTFYSGTHSIEKFRAKRNEAFELPNANELTFLKEGYDRLDFSFEDTEQNMVSLSDERFKDKVVLVQIMGTWCPNCLDESRFYVQYLKDNPSEDLAVVALAFEYAKTKENALTKLKRFKNKESVPYPILLAQYGGADKDKANEKLPMLNHVLSYPTTIYIDKSGNVRKIHTGFNGPATGEKYVEFQKEFKETLTELMAE